jgi:hypothetical protein
MCHHGPGGRIRPFLPCTDEKKLRLGAGSDFLKPLSPILDFFAVFTFYKEVSMKKTIGFLLCVALLQSAEVMAAANDDGNGQPGTVNYFTIAQKTQAFGAATKAGYTPTTVEAFQDGNFFLTARKGGQNYEVTVLPSGQVYVSTPILPMS